MKTIVKEITTAILATLLFAVVLCGIYPVIIWGISQLVFPHQANGSLIEGSDRKIIGSDGSVRTLPARNTFTRVPRPRVPTATTRPVPAAPTSGRPRKN